MDLPKAEHAMAATPHESLGGSETGKGEGEGRQRVIRVRGHRGQRSWMVKIHGGQEVTVQQVEVEGQGPVVTVAQH